VENASRYLPSIGMEVHAQLLTESKMFCACPTRFGDLPNTNVCPVCLGMPGVLPVPNKKAVEHVIRTALALNCRIAPVAMFYRKNYFYPDLPKGYQISQYGEVHPIGTRGYLEIEVEGARLPVRIRRVHLEEDTGKLFHYLPGESEVDFNRAGAPLMEIVTDFPPDLHSAEAAKEYLVQLRAVLTYLGVCDGKMEEGSLRCEPNISVAPAGSTQLGVKTELKNLNSFRAVVRGIEFEVERQIKSPTGRAGKWCRRRAAGARRARTASPCAPKSSSRTTATSPNPTSCRYRSPTSGWNRCGRRFPNCRYRKPTATAPEYGLGATETRILTADIHTATYFEQCVALGVEPKTASNWITVELQARLNETNTDIRDSKLQPAHLADLIDLLHKGTISGRIAKALFDEVFQSGEMPSKIVQARGLVQISDEDALRAAARKVIADNPDVVAKYRAGKTSVLGFLVGQLMRETQGRANPNRAGEILREELD
jgi:aspartyl-tRNA(Asn)/glutamyl-tRNA(Gln) amidotransferase subunit B